MTSLVSREDAQSAESTEVVERTFPDRFLVLLRRLRAKRIYPDRKLMRFRKLLTIIRISTLWRKGDGEIIC